MITIFIHGFWAIVHALLLAGGVSTSLTTLNNVISPISSAVTTVNGYLSYVYFFIPQSLALFIIAVTMATIAIRIVMAIINLIVW